MRFKTVLFIVMAVLLLGLTACGEEPVPQVDISQEAKILTEDGVSYAYAEVPSAAAKDLTQLNTWYTDYYKDKRDNGEIISLVVRYSDDTEHATLFNGINVYTGCEIDKNNNASMKTYETWYRTESDRDRVLYEQEQ